MALRGAMSLILRDRPLITSEASMEMLGRASNMSLRDYSSSHPRPGLSPIVIERNQDACPRKFHDSSMVLFWRHGPILVISATLLLSRKKKSSYLRHICHPNPPNLALVPFIIAVN